MSKFNDERLKSQEEKEAFKQKTSGYSKELLDKVAQFKTISNYVIVLPNIITMSGKIYLGKPEVCPVVDIIAVGPECKVAAPGHKAILNYVSIGAPQMYETYIDGKLFMCLMETQLSCTYDPKEISILEEIGLDNPTLSKDSNADLAFTEERINHKLTLPN